MLNNIITWIHKFGIFGILLHPDCFKKRISRFDRNSGSIQYKIYRTVQIFGDLQYDNWVLIVCEISHLNINEN